MNKTRSLLFLSLLLLSFNSWGRNCDNQSGARHFNPNDEVGNPTGGFVALTAKVDAGVYLGPNVEVCDRAIVSALGSDTPRIEDEVKVYGRAKISGNVTIKDQVEIFGGAKLEASGINHILVREKAKIYGYAKLSNNARVQGNAIIAGTVRIEANGRVCKDNKLERAEYVFNRFDFCPIPYAEFKINRNQSNINFPNREVSFDAIDSSERNGSYLTLRYIWDFGDQSDEGENEKSELTHSYRVVGKYFVKMTAIDKNGESDSLTLPLEVELPLNTDPISFIKADVFATKKNHLTVNFNGSDSSDEDGIVVSYDWDFGDGTTATGPKPIHQFIGPGVFTVALKVTDELGGFNTSYAEITVNCEQEIGDTTCSRIIGHDDRIIPISDEDIAIELVPNLSPIADNKSALEVYVESSGLPSRLDISGISRVEDGRLKISMEELLKKSIDLHDEFKINFNALDESGVEHTSTITNIYFGSGTIKGRVTDRSNATIILKGTKFDLYKEIRLGSSGEFEFKNLPFDGYLLIAKYADEYRSDLVVAFPQFTSERIISFNEIPTKTMPQANKNLLKFEKQLKGQDPRSNFAIEKIVFTPDKVGKVAKLNYKKKIPANKDSIIVAYQVFTIGEETEDLVNLTIKVPGKAPIDFTRVTTSIPADKEFPQIGDAVSTSHWETIEVKKAKSFKQDEIEIEIEMSATSLKRGPSSSCGSAIGVGVVFEQNQPRIIPNSIKRIDGHGNETSEYFPTSVDLTSVAPVPSGTKGPLPHSYNKGWFLEFTVTAQFPKNQKYADLGLSVERNDSKKEDKNTTQFFGKKDAEGVFTNKQYSVVQKEEFSCREFNCVNLIVQLPIDSIGNNPALDWLNRVDKIPVTKVNFLFTVSTIENGTARESAPVFFNQIPLYNGRLIPCPEFGNVIDRYLTWHSFLTLKKMLTPTAENLELPKRLKCNDGSLPFGGAFRPHKTGHKIGKNLDITYLTHSLRNNELSARYLERKDLIRQAVFNREIENSPELKKLADWVDDLRLGFKALGEFNQVNGKLIQNLIISRGAEDESNFIDIGKWNISIVVGAIIGWFDLINVGGRGIISVPIIDRPIRCNEVDGVCSLEKTGIVFKYVNDKTHLYHHHLEFLL